MVSCIIAAIGIGVVLLFGCLGETLNEKAGHLNLGMPGIMCMGTFGGCFGVELYLKSLPDAVTTAVGVPVTSDKIAQEMFVTNMHNISNPSWIAVFLLAVFFAMLFAAFGGLIYAFLTVTLRCNQNITGLALTTFGAGFTDYFMGTLTKRGFNYASVVLRRSLVDIFPSLGKLGWFADIFLSHGILVYIAIALAIIMAILLKKSRVGLNLRAVGENPATADAAGININAYKYAAILIGAAIAGLGGLYYVMCESKGSWMNSSTIQAFGWLAIALVIFTVWKPDLAIAGSVVFGFLYVFNSYSSAFGIKLPSLASGRIVELLPYVITIIVLIVTSIVGKKETQPPASLGINYFREER